MEKPRQQLQFTRSKLEQATLKIPPHLPLSKPE